MDSAEWVKNRDIRCAVIKLVLGDGTLYNDAIVCAIWFLYVCIDNDRLSKDLHLVLRPPVGRPRSVYSVGRYTTIS